MGAETAIGWTHSTFNPWWGCTKISPGCDHCYAETFDKRVGGAHWGKGAPRRTFGDKHWAEPLKWNAAAAKAGERRRVFCASMADVFDAEAPEGALERLWALIRATPSLDWLLLTKRPSRIRYGLPPDWGDGYPNVWLGTTVEDQERAEQRVPVLLQVQARVRFLSVEPQVGPVDLAPWLHEEPCRTSLGYLTGACQCEPGGPIHWVICGGESGHGARTFRLEWARALLGQCQSAGVAFFMKQVGARPFSVADRISYPRATEPKPDGFYRHLNDRAGANAAEWPEDLRVREFPESNP